MKIQLEFSKHANAYNQYNRIQERVVKRVIEKIAKEKPMRMLDIGCGRGALYERVDWKLEKFVGIDFAQGMLALHPKSPEVTLYQKDFNLLGCCESFKEEKFERIVSASSLQWAEDLSQTLSEIASLQTPVSLAIFTSGTFKTLHETAHTPPLLRSLEEVKSIAKTYFKDAEYTTLNYTLAFSSVREMFRYMKQSGVGGARNLLGIQEMKRLMREYPLGYLEYEILLIHEEKRA
jgi:malonyl-CoA O-methyltransferase